MCSKQNICSMCGGGAGSQPNFQKQVDPPIRPYGTILGDDSPQEKKGGSCRGGTMPPMQICLPTVCPSPCSAQGKNSSCQQPCIIQVPTDPVRSCPKIVCDPCPPPPPTKVWLIKSSPVPQKSFAIAQPPSCTPLGTTPIIIPCQRQ